MRGQRVKWFAKGVKGKVLSRFFRQPYPDGFEADGE